MSHQEKFDRSLSLTLAIAAAAGLLKASSSANGKPSGTSASLPGSVQSPAPTILPQIIS